MIIESQNDNLFTRDKHDHDAISVRYLITSPLDPEQAALRLCREQSLGYKPVDPWFFERFAAKYIPDSIQKLKEDQFIVDVDFPLDLTGHSLTMVLDVIGGDTFNIRDLYPIKILTIEFPQAILENHEGPLYGVNGLRKMFSIDDRPLLLGPVKPCIGLTAQQFSYFALEAYRGGVDIVKDDELLRCDAPNNALEERVARMYEVVQQAEKETGEKKMYFAFIGDGSYLNIIENARIAQRNGANGLMVAPAINGLEIILDLISQPNPNLPIIAHNAYMHSAHAENHGISFSVLALIQRLCGADIMITPAKYGTFDVMSKEEQKKTIHALRKPIPKLKKTFPAFAGGQSAETISLLRRDVDSNDFIVVSGAALFEHPEGPREGARRLREAIAKLY